MFSDVSVRILGDFIDKTYFPVLVPIGLIGNILSILVSAVYLGFKKIWRTYVFMPMFGTSGDVSFQGGAARRNACEGVERMRANVSSRSMAYTFRWAKCKYFLLIYCHLGLAKCH